MPGFRAFLTAFIILIAVGYWGVQQFVGLPIQNDGTGQVHQYPMWVPSEDGYWDWNRYWATHSELATAQNRHILCFAAEELLIQSTSGYQNYAEILEQSLKHHPDATNDSVSAVGVPQGGPILYALCGRSIPELSGPATVLILINEKSWMNDMMIQRFAERNGQGQVVSVTHPATQGESLTARFPWAQQYPVIKQAGHSIFQQLFLEKPNQGYENINLITSNHQFNQRALRESLAPLNSALLSSRSEAFEIKVIYVPYDLPRYNSEISDADWLKVQQEFVAELSQWTRQNRWELIDVQALSSHSNTVWYQSEVSFTDQAHELIAEVLHQQMLARVALSSPGNSE